MSDTHEVENVAGTQHFRDSAGFDCCGDVPGFRLNFGVAVAS